MCIAVWPAFSSAFDTFNCTSLGDTCVTRTASACVQMPTKQEWAKRTRSAVCVCVCVCVCVFQIETAVPLAQTQTGGETGAKTYNLASKEHVLKSMCSKRASAHTFNNLALANIAEEELRRPLVRCQLIPHLLQSLCTRTPHVTTIHEHQYLSSIYAYVYLSIHLSIYILCVCIYIRTDIRTYTYMLGGLLLFLLPHTH